MEKFRIDFPHGELEFPMIGLIEKLRRATPYIVDAHLLVGRTMRVYGRDGDKTERTVSLADRSNSCACTTWQIKVNNRRSIPGCVIRHCIIGLILFGNISDTTTYNGAEMMRTRNARSALVG